MGVSLSDGTDIGSLARRRLAHALHSAIRYAMVMLCLGIAFLSCYDAL